MSETTPTTERPTAKIDASNEPAIEVAVLTADEVQAAVTACEICGPDGGGY